MEFYERLRMEREELGLKQKEMAEKAGTTLSYYSKIELGLRNPSYNFMEKFKANFGDACVDEIFFKKK